MAIEKMSDLEKLGYHQQLVFAYLTCERLYPNYVHFSDNFKFGNKQVLRAAIDLIVDALVSSNVPTHKEISDFLIDVDANTPYPHNFNTILVSSALDSCNVIMITLEFILDKQVSMLNDISTLATDTVYMIVHERDKLYSDTDSQFDQKIHNDPLMRRELAIQNGIVTYLTKIDNIGLVEISNLLELQYNNGKSNIDLE